MKERRTHTIEGICPDCGGYLYEDTTRGEYGWLACDTCDYSVNIISGREEREENDNGTDTVP